ncbi:MAG: class I adenylate-forming enzyme family protein [Myxococcota bacterium]
MSSAEANVASWLVRHAAERGDQPALADTTRRLDYAALEERVRRCAGALAARDVGRGDRVALVLGNATPFLETVLACARLGAIAVPLNARLTARELHGLLADCTPSLLVTDADHRAAAAGACEGLPTPPAGRLDLDDASYEAALTAADPIEEVAPVSPDDPMLLLYTSGTTGTPKGALLPHRKTLANARNAEIFFGLGPRDRVLVVLPLFHSFGLKILALPTLHSGGLVLLQRHFDPARVWHAVTEEGITFFGGVPTMFRSLLEALHAPETRDLDRSTLRFLFGAGAAVPVELIRGFERRGLVLKQGFGQTETSILCCLDARDAVRKAGSVGRPVEHAEVRCVRLDSLDQAPSAWQDVAPGETGEIVVRGPLTMIGYWQRPDATAEVLREGWLRTGDLATVDEDGFYTLVGRARHMFISGGENVYPAEVEAAFLEHPAVREIAVLGVPDERWGEVGHAWWVPEPGQEVDEAALRAWGSERLADFKRPQRFIRVSQLPRTETGKVKKHELPA